MKLSKAKEFYSLLKDEFNDEKFKPFYSYFEVTWLNLIDGGKAKFNFQLWYYHAKFDLQKNRKTGLISKEGLDEYVFVSNNACESINNLIIKFIQINAKVSLP